MLTSQGYSAIPVPRSHGIRVPVEVPVQVESVEYDYAQTLEKGRLIATTALEHSIPGRTAALLVTVIILSIYAGPAVISVQLGADPDAGFWIGKFGLLALMLPLFFLFMYSLDIFLSHRGRQSSKILLITMLCPAILFVVIGGAYMGSSAYLYGQLKSMDCSAESGLDKKPLLQEAYDDARSLYDECLQILYVANGNTSLTRRPTLQSCEEWVGKAGPDFIEPWKGYGIHNLGRRHRWSKEFYYLANVEANHICGGFCFKGPPLWNNFDYDDLRVSGACAQFVAMKFLVIEHEGEVVFWVGIVAAIFSTVMYRIVRRYPEAFGRGRTDDYQQ